MSVRALLVSALMALVLLPVAASAAPVATASKHCGVSGHERDFGASYVLKITARKTSCGKAKKVVRRFQSCRLKHGAAGHCGRRVKGYKCSEHRFNKLSTQYDSRVKCRKGSKRVKHTYSQFT